MPENEQGLPALVPGFTWNKSESSGRCENMTEQTDGQVSLFDQDTWSGRTLLAHSAATKARTSEQSSTKRSGSFARKPPLFLYLRMDGPQAAASWETNGALRGAFSMRSFGESPSAAVESRLSQILQDNPPPKYYLSAKSCLGILNRAKRRGKELPEQLRLALIQQSQGALPPDTTGAHA